MNNINDKMNPDDWVEKAFESSRDCNHDQAIIYIQRAIEMTPNNAITYCNIGAIYGSMEYYNEALKSLMKAIELDPYNMTAYDNMGITYGILGNFKREIGCYLKVIEYSTIIDSTIYFKIGHAFFELDNIVKAIEYFQKAVDVNPIYWEAFFKMGLCNSILGNIEKGIECYQEVLIIKPDYAKAFHQMGFSYRQICLFTKAEQCFQKAARLGYKESQKILEEIGVSW